MPVVENGNSEAVKEVAKVTQHRRVIRAPLKSAPVPEVKPEVIQEVKPKSKDIGNWKFTPWRGVDMWTHQGTNKTTFNVAEAKKLRHL